MIDSIHMNIFTEIGLDTFYTHLQKWLQQRILIPVDGLVVSKVNSSRVIESREVRTLRGLFFQQRTDKLTLLGFPQLFCTLGNVWQLPQTYLESLISESFYKTFWVREALGVELPGNARFSVCRKFR